VQWLSSWHGLNQSMPTEKRMVNQMVQLLVLAGLVFIIFRMLTAWKWSDRDPQEEYVLRGLALAVFAVGAFSVGSWLMKILFASMLDANVATLGGWIIASLMVLLLLDQSDRRKPIQVTLRNVTAGFISKVPVLKIQRIDNVISSGFKSRSIQEGDPRFSDSRQKRRN
jgi:hypothetical protein